MQEIIYKIDNWTLVKLLGGFAIILTAIIGAFSKYFIDRLTQSSQHFYNKEIENIKGEITKNNGTLNSAIQNYFSSSQKILDKKIQAYELLWSCILNVSDSFPAGIYLVYQLLTDNEIEKDTAFKDLDNNPKMGPILRSYQMEKEMKTMIDHAKSLMPHKPYISDNSYKLFYTYQGLIGRIVHKFIWDYENKRLSDWKKDKNLEIVLKVTLSEQELDYVKGIKINALKNLIDLLEYKILQDFRSNLNIKNTTDDTIDYLKDIERILSTSQK